MVPPLFKTSSPTPPPLVSTVLATTLTHLITSNNQRSQSVGDKDERSKRFNFAPSLGFA